MAIIRGYLSTPPAPAAARSARGQPTAASRPRALTNLRARTAVSCAEENCTTIGSATPAPPAWRSPRRSDGSRNAGDGQLNLVTTLERASRSCTASRSISPAIPRRACSTQSGNYEHSGGGSICRRATAPRPPADTYLLPSALTLHASRARQLLLAPVAPPGDHPGATSVRVSLAP